MKALFLKPPAESVGQNVVRDFVYGCWCNGRRIGGMQMPPLNELYCVTHARAGGVDAEFVDAQACPDVYEQIALQGFADYFAVVLMTSTQSFQHDLIILRQIKEHNPQVRSILFGSHPTFMGHYCLQHDVVDYIVRREPEQTIRELLLALLNGQPTDDLAGIGYRDDTGQACMNPDRPFMDLNDLPIPDRRLLSADVDYFNPVVKRVPYTTMQTSRGCPGRCIFCTAPTFYGNKYRFRSAEKVLEELREVQRLGYREVFFRDETFTTNRKRNREICEGILSEGIDLTWIANGRVDLIDRESMVLMKRAGCHMLKFGVETGSDEILRNYRKGTTTDQAREVFAMAHQVGLETHAHIVIGGPGESRETIRKTIEFVKELDPTTASFGILTPYPGSPLFEMVAQQHPEIRDGSSSTMSNLHTEGFYSQAICDMPGNELSEAVTMAYRSFYLRPSYPFKQLARIRSLEQFMILLVAGLNIFKFSLSGKK